MKLLYLVESGKSKFLVFDEMPDKISTKYGDDTIIGRIGGIFYDFLAKRNERREAFGGRKFDIVLDNGEIEKCEGQWWDAVTDRAREELEKEGNPLSKMVLIGVSSVDRLLDCYVYYGFYGLPLFKATAVKYGWDNPIGEDSGRERKYDSQY